MEFKEIYLEDVLKILNGDPKKLENFIWDMAYLSLVSKQQKYGGYFDMRQLVSLVLKFGYKTNYEDAKKYVEKIGNWII